jgi:hypothetical protein
LFLRQTFAQFINFWLKLKLIFLFHLQFLFLIHIGLHLLIIVICKLLQINLFSFNFMKLIVHHILLFLKLFWFFNFILLSLQVFKSFLIPCYLLLIFLLLGHLKSFWLFFTKNSLWLFQGEFCLFGYAIKSLIIERLHPLRLTELFGRFFWFILRLLLKSLDCVSYRAGKIISLLSLIQFSIKHSCLLKFLNCFIYLLFEQGKVFVLSFTFCVDGFTKSWRYRRNVSFRLRDFDRVWNLEIISILKFYLLY